MRFRPFPLQQTNQISPAGEWTDAAETSENLLILFMFTEGEKRDAALAPRGAERFRLTF